LLFGWVCFGFLGWLWSGFSGKICITSEGCFAFSVTVTWQTRYAVSGDMVVNDTVSHDSPGDYRYSEAGFYFTYGGVSGYVYVVGLDSLRSWTVYCFQCGGLGGWLC